ncbi:MAG: murein biosynthesis integral membrane protein MurJ [Blastocatellia bacterium]|nr:murein biosynthesis integral membrane protein MurJ [Blastocatellia bacterium]
MTPQTPKPAQKISGSILVAIGILASRLSGLVRDRVISHYLGLSAISDAYTAAFRIPNFLQNLLGEGALSASFIPAYARLLAAHKEEDAGKLAGAVFSLLALTVSVLVLIGVSTAPFLTSILAPGFQGTTRELAVQLIRITFPGIGVLVLSAWCLGVLNSHRRFLLSYIAPVAQNLAIIAAVLLFRHEVQERLVMFASWGAVVGSILVFGVQIPTVLRLTKGLRFKPDLSFEPVRQVVRNFIPAVASRGVVQISAYVDGVLASWLPEGAVRALLNAQTISMLPVSLFGMSISAVELTELSRTAVGESPEVAQKLRARLDAALKRVAFFIIPSVAAFLFLGDVIVGALYQSGKFGRNDTLYVWGILAGSAVGLLASTLGRLYSSTYYALGNTRTPLKFAIIRICLTTVLGYLCAIPLPPLVGLDVRWGTAGLTASAGFAGWVEFLLLRSGINQRIGKTGLPAGYVLRVWAAALAATALGFGVKYLLGQWPPLWLAVVVFGPFGAVFFGVAMALRIPLASEIGGKVLRRLKRN